MKQNTYKYAFAVLSIAILLIALFKATFVPFTHDESFSFRMIDNLSDRQFMITMANNHWLNTLSMWFSYLIFPKTELTFRWQSVVAFAIYAFFTFKISTLVKSKTLKIFAATLLLLNLYLLDYFSLARGYGLCCGFLMGSIYYLLIALKNNEKISDKNSLLSILFGVISMASVYVSLNYYIALVILLFIANLKGLKVKSLVYFALVTIPALIVIKALLIIKEAGDLGYGADNSIVNESFVGVVRRFFYNEELSKTWINAGLTIWFAGLAFSFIAFIYYTVKQKLSFHFAPILILTTVIAFSLIQHKIFHTPYPYGRTILPIILFWNLAVIFTLEKLSENVSFHKVGNALILLISSGILLNFVFNLKLDRVYEWDHNANDDKVADVLRTQQQQLNAPITFGFFYLHATTIPFFYLNDLNDNGMLIKKTYGRTSTPYANTDSCHYVYLPHDYYHLLKHPDNFTPYLQFENTKTTLFKNKLLVK